MRKIVALLALLGAACGPSQTEPPPRSAAGDAAADLQTIREANAAAGTVVRVVGDCDAVKVAIPEALRRLDAIAPRLRTEAARTSLEALRKQVNDAAAMCP